MAALLADGVAGARAGLTRFLARPDAPRLLALALLVAAFLLHPWFVVALAFLALLAAGTAVLVIGTDVVAERIATWHGRLARRDPERAETIRARAAAISRHLGALLDRLPESWTTGLYLPDFEPEAQRPAPPVGDPFLRLAESVREEEIQEIEARLSGSAGRGGRLA